MDGGACPLRRTSERTKRVIKNVFVGVDLAKEVHWVCAIDHGGKTLLRRKLRNGPEDVAALVVELRGLGGERRVGIDVMGGIATLLTAMLLEAGESLVHVPGRAVNRARQGTSGGETKSDPKDALVIADQVRIRRDLRPVEMQPEMLVELRLLVSQRTDLVHEQTRRFPSRNCVIAPTPSRMPSPTISSRKSPRLNDR